MKGAFFRMMCHGRVERWLALRCAHADLRALPGIYLGLLAAFFLTVSFSLRERVMRIVARHWRHHPLAVDDSRLTGAAA
jgi:hypothetical protein